MSDIYFIGARQSDAQMTASRVGGKAANLARLDALGLRVPPALALDTSVSREFMRLGHLPESFAAHLTASLRQLEQATSLALGGRRPLLLSVRSSPPVSMPGMLDTVIDVGLTGKTVPGLVGRTGNPWLAWDAYRRAIRSFGEVVVGVHPSAFDAIEARCLRLADVRGVDELDPLTLRDLARAMADLLQVRREGGLPADPFRQVIESVEAVLRSWGAPRAVAYRGLTGISDDTGTGVVIQAMVFGNAGPRSGSGVGFTRNPATGANELYLDFAFNAQGEDVVAGRSVIEDSLLLPDLLPQVYAELQAARPRLEGEFGDMQDFEFTVEEGQLYFLQTRDGKRTPWAALQTTVDLVAEGVVDMATGLRRIAALDLDAIARSSVAPLPGISPLATGVGAAPGVASGVVVLSADRVERVARTSPVVLVRPEIATGDIAGLSHAAGMLSTTGGRTSHGAVVARQLGRPCVVGCADLRVDELARSCAIGGQAVHEGDAITIDGDTGQVFPGVVPVIVERPDALLRIVSQWRATLAA